MKKMVLLAMSLLLTQSCDVISVLPEILDPCGTYETIYNKIENSAINFQNNPTRQGCINIVADFKKLSETSKACSTLSQSEKNEAENAYFKVKDIDCSILN